MARRVAGIVGAEGARRWDAVRHRVAVGVGCWVVAALVGAKTRAPCHPEERSDEGSGVRVAWLVDAGNDFVCGLGGNCGSVGYASTAVSGFLKIKSEPSFTNNRQIRPIRSIRHICSTKENPS